MRFIERERGRFHNPRNYNMLFSLSKPLGVTRGRKNPSRILVAEGEHTPLYCVAFSHFWSDMPVQNFLPPRRLLLGPGPSMVHPRVLRANLWH